MAEIPHPASDELRALLQPGAVVRFFYNEGNRHNQLRHICAVVDDDYIVYRVWSPAGQRWRYRVEYIYSFQLRHEEGGLTIKVPPPSKEIRRLSTCQNQDTLP